MTDKKALVFPGQGSQKVGMGQALAQHFPEAAQVFDEVDEVLGYKLSAICFDGPEDRLRQTHHAQPALMAVSMAVVRVLEARGIDLSSFSFMAGHSLGEFTALCASGVLTLAQTARLLDIRGRAMQEASEVTREDESGGDAYKGVMAAVIGLEAALLDDLPVSHTAPVCVLANDNAAGQVVLSGHQQGLDKAKDWVLAQGARFVPLPVSGAFHSPLMDAASARLSEALESETFLAPRVPIITNVSAAPQTDPATLKKHIKQQVTGRVRWRETMDVMRMHGITYVVEAGAGRVLCGLFKRQHPDIQVAAAGDVASVEALF
ncbi:ACP S-malonyltransferase [bacterium NHP-B]|nr:ACP S-malonyltransferase [bacterium NHP-B]